MEPMARMEARLLENAPGDSSVDETCIDCATCRFVAPDVSCAGRRARGVAVSASRA